MFKYISCPGLTLSNSQNESNDNLFKYISCPGLTEPIDLCCYPQKSLNTSHVLV